MQTGTRKIRGHGHFPANLSDSKVFGQVKAGTQEERWMAGPDGLEETPAWACQSGCPVAELDQQSGTLKSGYMPPDQERKASHGKGGYHGGFIAPPSPSGTYGDQGGASRFFPQFAHDPDLDAPFRYVAKASARERSAGLPDGRRNRHETVKPVALMRWLVRLVTPPGGGIVLDPFCGSGSTGVAAALEGFRFVGLDLEAEYLEDARARIAHAVQTPEQPALFA